MKRILALLLALLTIFALTACGSGEDADASKESGATSSGSNQAETSGTSDASDTSNTPDASAYADALAVLDAIWNQYPDEDKFSVLGGNRDAIVEGKPGAFDLSATVELTNSLLLPAEEIPNLQSAASLIHMLNGNTFTAAVFQTSTDLDILNQTMIDTANATQFICGAPERLVVLKVGNYLIMAFGTDDLTEAFQNHALEVEGITLLHNGPVVFNGGSNNGGGFGGVAIPVG